MPCRAVCAMVARQWAQEQMSCRLLKMRSYPLHLSRPKQAIGSNKQHKNHHQVWRNLVDASPQEASQVSFVTSSQVLHQANNDAAHDRPGDRINTTQDNGGECQQSRASQCDIYRKGAKGEKNPANGSNGGSET